MVVHLHDVQLTLQVGSCNSGCVYHVIVNMKCTKTTDYEKYELAEADFCCLNDLVHVQSSIGIIGRGLGGNLCSTPGQTGNHAIPRCNLSQPQLKLLVDKMEEDYMVSWGAKDWYRFQVT